MGYIEKLPNGRWKGTYRAPDGRERSRTLDRKVDVQRFLTAVESSKLRGDWVDPALGQTRLEEWLPKWLESVRPSLKPSTAAGYASLIRSRILPALGPARIGALRPSDVQAWIAAMQEEGLSASRIRKAQVVLAAALDAAVADSLIARNPARGVRLPRIERKEAAYFEPAVVDAVAEAVGEYRLLVLVLGRLGPRFGEAAALRRSSVDLLRRRLRIDRSITEVDGRLVEGTTKGHAQRSVPIPAGLAVELEEHLAARVAADPDARLFTAPAGGPLRHRNFEARVWRPTLRQLGLPHAGLHVLRHSAASLLISAGGSPKAVQTVLGHAQAAFTLTVYAHLFDADMDALAARLDELSRGLSRPVRGLGRLGPEAPGERNAV